MDNPFIDILFLALIAGFFIWRLRTVLGRKTGNERPPQQPYGQGNASHRQNEGSRQTAKTKDNVINLPGRASEQYEDPEAQRASIEKFAPKGSQLADDLLDLQMADRTFTPESFISGAKMAYEMIVTSFAANDRETLQPLLSDDVFERFDQVMNDRERQDLTVETEFVGVQSADFIKVRLKDHIAEVTVKFISELVSATKNADGAVVEGDPTRIKKVTDVWTFSRDTSDTDPNWKLIGTAADV